jgi:hypothetical protein
MEYRIFDNCPRHELIVEATDVSGKKTTSVVKTIDYLTCDCTEEELEDCECDTDLVGYFKSISNDDIKKMTIIIRPGYTFEYDLHPFIFNEGLREISVPFIDTLSFDQVNKILNKGGSVSINGDENMTFDNINDYAKYYIKECTEDDMPDEFNKFNKYI